MSKNYLDKTGLARLWEKITSNFATQTALDDLGVEVVDISGRVSNLRTEVDQLASIGDPNDLETDEKSIIGGINELHSEINNIFPTNIEEIPIVTDLSIPNEHYKVLYDGTEDLIDGATYIINFKDAYGGDYTYQSVATSASGEVRVSAYCEELGLYPYFSSNYGWVSMSANGSTSGPGFGDTYTLSLYRVSESKFDPTEVSASIGNLTDLNTTDQSNLVGAINETLLKGVEIESYSLGTKGYVKFKNGFLINWGTTAIATTSSTGNHIGSAVTFAKAFNTAVVWAGASRTGTNQHQYFPAINAFSKTTITAMMSTTYGYASNWTVRWIAIGY